MISTRNSIFFITGIKHSGKSSVGLYAAKILKTKKLRNFIDLDDLIKELLPSPYISIRSFYEREGKSAFMKLEISALSSYLQGAIDDKVYIISLGGGACDNSPLVDLMKRTGTIIYLSLLEETLLQRIERGGVPPFLDKNNVKGSFHDLFVKRDAQYRIISDFVVSLADFESIESNGNHLASFITQLLGDTTWAEIPLEHH